MSDVSHLAWLILSNYRVFTNPIIAWILYKSFSPLYSMPKSSTVFGMFLWRIQDVFCHLKLFQRTSFLAELVARYFQVKFSILCYCIACNFLHELYQPIHQTTVPHACSKIGGTVPEVISTEKLLRDFFNKLNIFSFRATLICLYLLCQWNHSTGAKTIHATHHISWLEQSHLPATSHHLHALWLCKFSKIITYGHFYTSITHTIKNTESYSSIRIPRGITKKA